MIVNRLNFHSEVYKEKLLGKITLNKLYSNEEKKNHCPLLEPLDRTMA